MHTQKNRSSLPGRSLAATALATASALSSLLSGCGTPGAPQPPSLKLPERITDLTADRAGSIVTLHWTTPRKTTDRLLIQGKIRAVVCRREASSDSCTPAGETTVSPREQASFHDSLPASLATGPARKLIYTVELMNPKGRSAGPSYPAIILAGEAPGPITGLSAEVRADGVALHWDHASANLSVRLHRRLLNPPQPAKSNASLTQPDPEPPARDLLVPPPAPGQQSGALDATARFGSSYEYTAQRVEQMEQRKVTTPAGTETLELSGPISAPIKVDVIDTFPPAVPQGLAAVYVSEKSSIDLSWEPDTEPDLAGYIVYRSADTESWTRVSGPDPVTTPAYRDSNVQKGHTYHYAISAIDLTGHESKRSAEAAETTTPD